MSKSQRTRAANAEKKPEQPKHDHTPRADKPAEMPEEAPVNAAPAEGQSSESAPCRRRRRGGRRCNRKPGDGQAPSGENTSAE